MPGAIPYLTAYGWADNEVQIVTWGEMWSTLPVPAAVFEAIDEDPWATFYCPQPMWIAGLMRVLIYPSLELYLDKNGCSVGASVYAPHVAAIGGIRVGFMEANLNQSPGAWEHRRLPHPWLPGAWLIHEIEPKYWGGASPPRPGTPVRSVLFETDSTAEHRITAIHSGFSPEMELVVNDHRRFID